ncbi:aminotransferase class V-fold PLP-dependent enzyme [Aggregatimonas sangjinii]|uniref:Aminotransferase class V-fold PLP-dependent enzyme n=1 Tax=Aggregatimonas sangjinii TaxID=2583587 RepID=A0A5B7SKB4_9FLAO|nr:aminotransferase class V-fold PLP-dependent enzyme [Aggregatimonas sangjinii]QCW98934.1 aminotransferase class V-fold PLP-dependent enzyme [Aggregatimonas sangjinii]
MEKVRKQFPILRQYIYANTPVLGPLYDDLLDWRQEHDLDFIMKASGMRDTTLQIISECRTAVGTYFGCKGENIALVNNFSTGMNMLLGALDPNQKVLLLEEDYPSVVWPFETRGFPISYVEIDEHLEDNIRIAVQKGDVDILALSIVQWQNGIKIDLDFLKELKKAHPNLLILADGTQFCGTTSFDFESSGIDVLGTSAYKWLLSGYGSGFMLFKDNVKERCQLHTMGFNAANGDPQKKDSVRFARRFEPGHLACLNFGSLKFSLYFMDKVGKDVIDTQNRKLSLKAKKEFTELGILQEAVVKRKEHSTIFNIKGDDQLFQYLTDSDVICAQRGEGIRLGFHFYNTEKEIDAIVEMLKKRP